MGKTLDNKFKIGKEKGKKLDLVSVVNNTENRYKNDVNDIYSKAQSDREKYESLLNRYSDGDILNPEQKKYGFGKGAKRAVATLAAIVGLGFMGCSSPVSSTEEENNAPTITSSPIYEIEEGKSYSYLVKANDKDGDNLNYSISGPEWLSINQDGFISGTAPNIDEDKNCSVIVNVSDNQETVKQNYTLKVKNITEDPTKDYVDISGILQDNETDTGKIGAIRVYDTKNSDGTYSDLLGETLSDSEGKFSTTLNKLVDANDKIYVRSVMNNFDTPTSYIRTKELPAKDLELTKTSGTDVQDLYENGLMAVVPFDNPDNSYDDELDIANRKEDFKEHMGRVNFGDSVYINPAPNPESAYLKKWKPATLQEIEVSSGDFSEEHVKEIKTVIEDSGLINAIYLANKIILGDSSIDPAYGIEDFPKEGYGRILPKNHPTNPNGGIGSAAALYDQDQDGYIERFVVYLEPTELKDPSTLHEIAHALLFPGHVDNDIPENEKFPTNMTPSAIGRTSTFSSADIKANYIIDEPTYLGMENIDDILGL